MWHAATYTFIAGAAVSVFAALPDGGMHASRQKPVLKRDARSTPTPHIMITVTVLALADIVWQVNDYNTEAVTPIGIVILSVVIAVVVSVGSTFGGTLVFDHGFNVETTGDSPVWHKSETDVFSGQHDG